MEVSIAVDQLKRRFPLILGVTVLSMIVAFIVMWVQPPKWTVSSSLYFPIRPISLLSAASASASEASAAIGLGGPNQLNVNQSILQSQSVLDYVASQVPRSRVWLEKKLDVKPDITSSILAVSVDDEDPELAQKVVRSYVTGLEKVSTRLDVEPINSDLARLRSSLADWQRQLDQAQKSLLAFQQGQTTPTQVMASGSGDSSSVLVLPGNWLEQEKTTEVELNRIDAAETDARQRIQRMSQTPMTLPTEIPSAEKWRDRLVGEEYDLRIAKLTQPDSAPSVQMLQSQIDLTRQQLRDEISKYFQAVQLNVAAPDFLDLLAKKVSTEAQLKAVQKLAQTAPSQAAQYQRLLTQFTTDGAIVQKLRTQEVTAELKASVDSHHWQILDDARVSDKPINKSIGKTLALGAVIGIALGLLFAWISIGLQNRRRSAVA